MSDAVNQGQHNFEFVPAPDDLAPYLNSLFRLRVGPGGLSEMLPAYSGQLLLVVQGAGRMDFGNGLEEAGSRALFTGPLSAARRFEIDGPAEILGASINFHGWAALTRLPVADAGDRFVAVQAALGEEAAVSLNDLVMAYRAGNTAVSSALDTLASILRDRLRPLPPRHWQVIEETYRWLSSSLDPDAADLYAKIAVSQRQVQRLVKRFFGFNPTRLKRRYRAIRAATLLSDPTLDKARREEVFDAFYDQAHMIREIREFTGRTPRLLAKEDGALIGETLGAKGYGVSGLFAGEEEEQIGRRRS